MCDIIYIKQSSCNNKKADLTPIVRYGRLIMSFIIRAIYLKA